MTYKEAVDYLYSLIPPITGTLFPGDVGLKRTFALMEELGNPQDDIPIVHIAGTAGKGSTTYMTASILKTAGYKVGHHVSPHVVSIRERIQVDMEMVSKEDFVKAVEAVKPAVEAVSGGDMGDVTYFEALIGVTFMHFKSADIDVAVIETGLGGTFDATNVVNSLVSIITPIGFDHEKVLGSTIEQIAENKAGIIKESNISVILAGQRTDAKDVIEKEANGKTVSTQFLGQDFHVREYSMVVDGVQFLYTKGDFTLNVGVPLMGRHQAENASCSISAILALKNDERFAQISDEDIVRGLAEVRIPGRFEQIQLPLDALDALDATIILDGAHNPDKIAALVVTLQETKFNGAVLVAFKRGKNMENILSELKKVTSSVGITQFAMETDMGKGKDMCIPASEVEAAAKKVGLEVDFIEPDSRKALELMKNSLKERGLKQGLVTGSFFLVSEVRGYLLSDN